MNDLRRVLVHAHFEWDLNCVLTHRSMAFVVIIRTKHSSSSLDTIKAWFDPTKALWLTDSSRQTAQVLNIFYDLSSSRRKSCDWGRSCWSVGSSQSRFVWISVSWLRFWISIDNNVKSRLGSLPAIGKDSLISDWFWVFPPKRVTFWRIVSQADMSLG